MRSRLPRLWIAVAAMSFAAGCQTPGDWSTWEVDWPRTLEAQAQRSVDVPEPLRPQSPADVTFALPPGDEPAALSLEQAAMLALRNNRDLQVQQLNPVIVGTFEQIERGAYDPELFADAQYAESTASETTNVTGEQFNVEDQESSVIGGVRQRLPTGTTVELSGSEAREFSNRSPDQHQARVGLSVTQSLLQGFGPAVNLASIRQAQLDTLASVHELRGFTESLLAETETTYWNYALAQQQIGIFERSLQLARQQLDEVQQRIDVGVIPQTEAAAARAEVALREQELIDARSQLESQRLRLLRLLNPNPDDSLDRQLRTTSDPSIQPEAIDDLKDRLALAQQLRSDLNESRLRLEQNRLETIVTRNGLLPRLDLFITVGKSGYAAAFRDAVRDIDGDNYDFAAGVSFSYYLGNRAAEARDLAARASRQQAAAAVANLRQIVVLDVRLASTEVERARQQITATAATRLLREETVRAEQERFRVGASTSLLVAQAQRDLLASQIDEVEAVVGYRIARIDLYLAEGSLLYRRGIRLADPPPPGEAVRLD